jgi:hypothetical protein
MNFTLEQALQLKQVVAEKNMGPELELNFANRIIEVLLEKKAR